MGHLTPHSFARPVDGTASSRTRSGCVGGVLAAGWTAEGGPESREAAGLVLFKTSPGQTSTSPALHSENGQISVSFDRQTVKLKRLKRLKHSVWLAGQLHGLQRNGHRPDVPWFVTLTYASDVKWNPNHIAEAMDRFRAWCRRRSVPCRYIWVAELTAAGRVHYHLIAWLPQGLRMTFWDRPRRVKGKHTVAFWTHGHTNTQPAKHGVAYLMKYLSKMGPFHEFPDGLRLYGVGGLDAPGRLIRSWSNLPFWVRSNHGVGDVRRAGPHLVNTSTGECLPPMYARVRMPGGMMLRELRPPPEKLYDHGPFCSYPRP